MWSPWAWLTMTASMVPGIGGWRSLESMPKSSSTRTPPCSMRYADAPRPPPPRMVTRAGGTATARCSSSGRDEVRHARPRPSRGPDAAALDDLRRRSLAAPPGGAAGRGWQPSGRSRRPPPAAARRRRRAPPGAGGGRGADVPRGAQQVVLRHRRVALALGLRRARARSPRAPPCSSASAAASARSAARGARLGRARGRQGGAAGPFGLLDALGGLALRWPPGGPASRRPGRPRCGPRAPRRGSSPSGAATSARCGSARCASRSSRSLRSFSSAFSCRRVRSAARRSRSRRRRSSSSTCSSPSGRARRRRPRPGPAPAAAPARPTPRSGSPPGSARTTGVPLTSMDSATRSMPWWPTSSSSGSSSSDGASTPPTWSTTRSRPSCQTNGVRRASCGKVSSPSASPSFRSASSGTHGGALRACGDRRFARWAIIERYPGSSASPTGWSNAEFGYGCRMSQELTWV